MKLEIDEVTYAWLAGFWDGEGTFGMIRENRRGNRCGKRYVAYMSVSNTNFDIMVELAKFFDRSLQHERGWSKHGEGRARPVYRLALRSGTILVHLPRMLPYLRVKRKQAEKILHYLQETRAGSTIGQRIPCSVLEESEQMWQELRELNQRGTGSLSHG